MESQTLDQSPLNINLTRSLLGIVLKVKAKHLEPAVRGFFGASKEQFIITSKSIPAKELLSQQTQVSPMSFLGQALQSFITIPSCDFFGTLPRSTAKIKSIIYLWTPETPAAS